MLEARKEEIKRRRLAMGVSQKALSLKAGLPYNAVYRIENGFFRTTHPLRAKEIAKALNCKIEDIFTPINKGA